MAFLWAVFLTAAATAGNLPELAAKTKPSVVRLSVRDASGKELGSGTGFFVSNDGRIVTNFHVAVNGVTITAMNSEGREIKILGALVWSAESDIAILQAEPGEYPALEVGDSDAIRSGDEVFVIGSPLGLEGTLSAGIVAAIREKGVRDEGPKSNRPAKGLTTEAWGIQITAPISPGSSGSPILDANGKVIAVAVGNRAHGQNLNFGIPSAIVTQMLGEIKPGAKPQPIEALDEVKGSDVTRNLLISAGVIAGIFVIWLIAERVTRRKAPPRGARRS